MIELKAPPASPVWWVATYTEFVGNSIMQSTCHVYTRLWFDAKRMASEALGVDVDPRRPNEKLVAAIRAARARP